MSHPVTIDLDIGTLAALATMIAFIGAGMRGMYRIARKVDELNTVARRELEHNHGSSIKDDVHGLAIAMGQLGRDVDALSANVNEIGGHLYAHHPKGS